MSESKFAGIFRSAKPTTTATAESDRPEPKPTQKRNEKAERAARPLGRPPGKRSDPAWKQFSVLLKKDTQREAANILRGKDEGLDLSRLIQNLLESWIKRQRS